MKTIFFAVTTKNVFRNLFFFPGSVFYRLMDTLKQRSDLRIVFLFPRKDYPKFADFVEPYKHERCIMEMVDFNPKQTFIQKVFYFFYSYLVYTGTTKTLATMGMRVDEPPAGGRWRFLLAPIKVLIANTFGRSRWIREVMVPKIFLHLYSGRPFKNIFDTYRPDLVFGTHIYGKFDMQLLAEAARNGVRTVGMISNWDHFDKYYLPFKVDALLAQSPQVRDLAIQYQWYRSEDIIVTGYPHCDLITQKKDAMTRAEILKSLGFSPDAKYIVFASGSAYTADEPDIIEKILEWADQNSFGCNLHVVIRPYLGGRGADQDFDEKKYNRFHEHPRVTFYEREFWGDLEKSIYFTSILRHADATVIGYSTMVLEAAVLDKPLISPSFDGYHERPFNRSIKRFELREHFQDILKTGALKQARNFDDLFRFLNEYLKNPHLDADKREKLREIALYKTDGKASERVVEELLRVLKNEK